MFEKLEKEAERYLGYGGMKADETIRSLIHETLSELQKTCRPRWTGAGFPLLFEDGLPLLGSMTLRSQALAKNLRGCSEVILFAATLGPECDRMIQRAEARSVTRAAVTQACGAAYIEAYVDEVNESLKEDALKRGLYARPRFSPGYGDLSLDVQKEFLRILDMPKTIGVTLTESLLMVPSKSVTAFIGLSGEMAGCQRSACEDCDQRDACEYGRTER